MTGDEPPVVLVVEDERDLADLYAIWLRDVCEVRTAYDGTEALSAIDGDVDVVFLDRRMPGLSGDEVLETIRGEGYGCRVAMVTAVEPDFDVVEMGFDDYLVKPVTEDELVGMVETLRLRSEYDDQLRELYALSSKKTLLESEKPDAELEGSDEYERLKRRLARLGEEVDEAIEELSGHEAFVGLFRDAGGGAGAGAGAEED